MKGLSVVLTQLERVVVFGGGHIAERKVRALLEAAIKPRVISPNLTETLTGYRAADLIAYRQGVYQPEDLQHAELVIAATNDAEMNAAIARAARALGCLCNRVDDASDGTCHLPASIREGELLLSLSSHAASPALMKHLKQNLRETVRGYGELLELLRDLREELKSLTPEARDAFIKQATQKELLELSQRNPALARFQLQRLLTPDTYSLGHINA